jgi:hypothetical protein
MGFNSVMSEEPLNPQLEGRWLEKISKLEVKVDIIQNEIEMRDRLIKDILADQIAGMKAALRQGKFNFFLKMLHWAFYLKFLSAKM